MTVSALTTENSVVPRRVRLPAGVLAVALVTTLVLATIGLRLIAGGQLRADVQAILSGEIWRAGGWLSHLLLHNIGLLPRGLPQQITLTVLTAILTGIGFGALYGRLRRNAWPVLAALVALGAVLLHSQVLYSITSESRYLPVFVAIALIVPAVRNIEEVGDVQAAISLSLLLPFLLLAGPVTSLFILPLALGATLADRDARTDPRAFIAMVLVTTLPTVIVVIGVFGFLLQSGADLGAAILPYAALFTSLKPGDLLQAFTALGTLAPVGVIPLIYCIWPDLSERRRVFSALAVVVVPLCLAAARVMLDTDMPRFVPPVAMIAAFFVWLGLVRLPRTLQVFTIVLLLASAVLSWMYGGFATEPEWAAALLHDIPASIGAMTMRPAL